VRQLEPGSGEGVCKLIRILIKTPGDLFVDRIKAQGEVGGQHSRRVTLRRVVGIGNRASGCAALWRPLICTGRALGQLPLVVEQYAEEVIAPFGRRVGPDALQTAADGVPPFPCAEAALPAQALILDARRLRLRPHMGGRASAMGLAEGVATSNEGHSLLVIHGHAGEDLPDILGRSDRIRVAVGAFRIDIDQAHLHGSQGIFQIPLPGIALLTAQPLVFSPPIDIHVRLPDVLPAPGEAEGLESHGLQSHVSRQDHQVCLFLRIFED